MKIYTKTGDDGTTGLLSGKRVSKASLRVELYGTADELNTIVGIVTTMELPDEMRETLELLNCLLFTLGSDLATPQDFDSPSLTRIEARHIDWLEKMIDEYSETMPALTSFILPGGTKASAYLQNARTVCRRAERLAVALAGREDLGEFAVKFLNRLSDFLFAAGRMANFLSGIDDVKWDKDKFDKYQEKI